MQPLRIQLAYVLMMVMILILAPRVLRADEVPNNDTINKLIAALQDTDVIVRLRAAKSLGELGPTAQPAVEALKNALVDPDEDVRMVVQKALERIQIQSNPELMELIGALRDPDVLNRLRAAKKLGQLGSGATPALPALEKALQDEDEDVIRVVQHAIEKIKSSGSDKVNRLIKQLSDKDAFVRLSAAKQLGDMGAEAQTAVQALKATSEDPDEVVRMVVKNALKNTSQQVIQVGTLRVHWLVGLEEIHNDDVDGPILPLLAGQTYTHTFALRWDRESKWDRRTKSDMEVSLAAPLDLSKADRLKLEAVKREHAKLRILNPNPIYSFGILMGDRFTIQNENNKISKGVLIALKGYDNANDWVSSLLYYAPLIPKGFTHIANDPTKPSATRRSVVKLVDYQNATPDLQVKRYEGVILGVGFEEDELPK